MSRFDLPTARLLSTQWWILKKANARSKQYVSKFNALFLAFTIVLRSFFLNTDKTITKVA